MEWLDGTLFHETTRGSPRRAVAGITWRATPGSADGARETQFDAAVPVGSGNLQSDRSIALAMGAHWRISCSNCSG